MITPEDIQKTFNVGPDDALYAANMLADTLVAGSWLIDNVPYFSLAYLPTFEISLHALNHLLPDCHGVEAVVMNEFDTLKGDLWHNWGCAVAFYLNRGDTYTPTILYDLGRHEFMITSWGDWYEENVIMGEPG